MIINDEDLIQQGLAGSRVALNRLIQRHQDTLFGFCYHLVGNITEAQDLTQDTFVRAISHLDQIKSAELFPAWLRQIARNLYRREVWNQRNRLMVGLENIDSPGHLRDMIIIQEEAIEYRDLQRHLMHAIQSLPYDYKLAIILYYFHGVSYREIAIRLNIPITTLKNRLHRARQRLKKELYYMAPSNLPEDFSDQVLNQLKIGEIHQAVVQRITHYGAFVNVDGCRALIHIKDMGRTDIKHPSELVTLNDTVSVKVLDINAKERKVSVGLEV